MKRIYNALNGENASGVFRCGQEDAGVHSGVLNTVVIPLVIRLVI